jgi:5S rRNA maturation endonuclease (ribonuclease M5)
MANMSLEDLNLNNTADYVRGIALEAILKQTGSIKHRYDKSKWHTCQGVISVSSSGSSGQKFMNWTAGIGGGGAIDLAIHLNECTFKTAVFWLLENVTSFNFNIGKTLKSEEMAPIAPIAPMVPRPTVKATLELPKRDVKRMPQVFNYLRYARGIPGKIISLVIDSGKLYADNRGNAVFLLLGKEKKAVGAELRGTAGLRGQRWQGMAPGSRKHLGAFYVKSPNPEKMVICESAIDAISYFALHPDCIAISTSGANPNPAWLSLFINKDFDIYCGFDSDQVGERLADKMIKRYPTVKRLRPERHDWNEELKAKLK